MTRCVRFGITLCLVSLSLLAIFACSGTNTIQQPTAQPSSPPPPPPAPTAESNASSGHASNGATGEGKEFIVTLEDLGGSYAFSPTDMTFNVGDAITFVLTAQSEFHTFTVDDLEIDVSVDSGETVKHTIIFDQPGTFNLLCIPHELQGMVGTITIN